MIDDKYRFDAFLLLAATTTSEFTTDWNEGAIVEFCFSLEDLNPDYHLLSIFVKYGNYGVHVLNEHSVPYLFFKLF